MELKQLRYFLALARTGSFSRAAVLLGVAQPMLSRQVQALEELLGVQLVYRNGRGVVLTEAGHLLQQHAEGIVSSVADAENAIKAVSETPTGEIVFGLPPMIGSVLTVPVVTAFRKRYPSVSLRVVEAFSGYVLEWLASARLDVAIIYNVSRNSFIMAEPLVDEEIWLVAATSMRLATSGPSVPMSDLRRVPLILPNQPHGLRSLIDGHLSKIGACPNVVVEVDGLSALLRLVEHGVGATLMSRGMASRLRTEGRLEAWPIVDPVIKGQLHLATSTQRPSTPVTRALAQIVRSEVRTLAPSNSWQSAATPPSAREQMAQSALHA